MCLKAIIVFLILKIASCNVCNLENIRLGKYYHAHETDITKFIQCSQIPGIYYVIKCPPNTMFSRKASVCVHYEESKFQGVKGISIEKVQSTQLQKLLSPSTTSKNITLLVNLIKKSEAKLKPDSTIETTTTSTLETQPMTSKLKKLIQENKSLEEKKEVALTKNDNFHITEYCSQENVRKNLFQFVFPYDNTKFIQCTNVPGIYFIISCPNNHIFDSYIGRCSTKTKLNYELTDFLSNKQRGELNDDTR